MYSNSGSGRLGSHRASLYGLGSSSEGGAGASTSHSDASTSKRSKSVTLDTGNLSAIGDCIRNLIKIDTQERLDRTKLMLKEQFMRQKLDLDQRLAAASKAKDDEVSAAPSARPRRQSRFLRRRGPSESIIHEEEAEPHVPTVVQDVPSDPVPAVVTRGIDLQKCPSDQGFESGLDLSESDDPSSMKDSMLESSDGDDQAEKLKAIPEEVAKEAEEKRPLVDIDVNFEAQFTRPAHHSNPKPVLIEIPVKLFDTVHTDLVACIEKPTSVKDDSEKSKSDQKKTAEEPKGISEPGPSLERSKPKPGAPPKPTPTVKIKTPAKKPEPQPPAAPKPKDPSRKPSPSLKPDVAKKPEPKPAPEPRKPKSQMPQAEPKPPASTPTKQNLKQKVEPPKKPAMIQKTMAFRKPQKQVAGASFICKDRSHPRQTSNLCVKQPSTPKRPVPPKAPADKKPEEPQLMKKLEPKKVVAAQKRPGLQEGKGPKTKAPTPSKPEEKLPRKKSLTPAAQDDNVAKKKVEEKPKQLPTLKKPKPTLDLKLSQDTPKASKKPPTPDSPSKKLPSLKDRRIHNQSLSKRASRSKSPDKQQLPAAPTVPPQQAQKGTFLRCRTPTRRTSTEPGQPQEKVKFIVRKTPVRQLAPSTQPREAERGSVKLRPLDKQALCKVAKPVPAQNKNQVVILRSISSQHPAQQRNCHRSFTVDVGSFLRNRGDGAKKWKPRWRQRYTQ